MLLNAGAEIRDVRVREPDLRDVFRELTGVELEVEADAEAKPSPGGGHP